MFSRECKSLHIKYFLTNTATPMLSWNIMAENKKDGVALHCSTLPYLQIPYLALYISAFQIPRLLIPSSTFHTSPSQTTILPSSDCTYGDKNKIVQVIVLPNLIKDVQLMSFILEYLLSVIVTHSNTYLCPQIHQLETGWSGQLRSSLARHPVRRGISCGEASRAASHPMHKGMHCIMACISCITFDIQFFTFNYIYVQSPY